jgi:hypothetical protein
MNNPSSPTAFQEDVPELVKTIEETLIEWMQDNKDYVAVNEALMKEWQKIGSCYLL